MKDAKGHGSDPKDGAATTNPASQPKKSWFAAHQSGVNKLGKAAKIGAYLYAAQAAAGVAGGIGWALWHTYGGG